MKFKFKFKMLEKKGGTACCPSVKIPRVFILVSPSLQDSYPSQHKLDKLEVHPFPNILGKTKIPQTVYMLISIESGIISWYVSTNVAKILPVGITLPTNSGKLQNISYA